MIQRPMLKIWLTLEMPYQTLNTCNVQKNLKNDVLQITTLWGPFLPKELSEICNNVDSN